MHNMPNSRLHILLLVAIIVVVGCANATFVYYGGHVYCRLSSNGANGTTKTEILPVKNVDMKLMERDGWFFYFVTAPYPKAARGGRIETCYLASF